MKFKSFRSAVVFASVIVGSVIPSQAFAQDPFDVFTGGYFESSRPTNTSTYKFTGSMILNSIGFVTDGNTPSSLSYTMKGKTYNVTDFNFPNLSEEENGFRWLTISPASMVAEEIITVTTEFYGDQGLLWTGFTQPSSSTNISYEGFAGDKTITNSNLRVSNPGINVAPEPGTLALALTCQTTRISTPLRH
jgi:hypothetical protein